MRALRRGHTSNGFWSDDPSTPVLGDPDKSGRQTVRYTFRMPSKGGGTTDVKVRIDPHDFGALLQAMMLTDADTTIRAIGRALVDHNRPPDDPVAMEAALKVLFEESQNS